MKNRRRTLSVGVFLALTVLATSLGGIAYAGPPRPQLPPPPPRRCETDWAAPINEAAAEAYGMTVEEVVAGLHGGATLEELADNVREVQALKAALREQVYNKIDQALADGVITEEQAATLRMATVKLVDRLVEDGGGPYWGKGVLGGKFWGAWRDTAAQYLEMSVEDLAAALLAGQSLAEVAEAQGKDVQGLIDALVAGAEDTLAQAVEDGILTQEQADLIEQGLGMVITVAVHTYGPCSFPNGLLYDILAAAGLDWFKALLG